MRPPTIGRLRSSPATYPFVWIMISSITIFVTFDQQVAHSKPIFQEKNVPPQYTGDNYPTVVEDGNDSYLVLNDDEVLENPMLLKHLASASKEEVEEIVDSNPAIQSALLKKIQNAVDMKEAKKYAMQPLPPPPPSPSHHHHHHQHQTYVANGKPVKGQVGYSDPEGDDDDGDNDDDEDNDVDDEPVDASKLALWRKKASKVFKIGSGFKDKLLASIDKKGDKKEAKKGALRWPHFHYNVSTN